MAFTLQVDTHKQPVTPAPMLPACVLLVLHHTQVPVDQRLAAFGRVLKDSLQGPDGAAVATYDHLPRLAVTFVAANLKVCLCVCVCVWLGVVSPNGAGAGDKPCLTNTSGLAVCSPHGHGFLSLARLYAVTTVTVCLCVSSGAVTALLSLGEPGCYLLRWSMYVCRPYKT